MLGFAYAQPKVRLAQCSFIPTYLQPNWGVLFRPEYPVIA